MKILDKLPVQSHASFDKELVLPMVPLKDIVLFPYSAMPLYIGRRFSLEAIEESLAGDKLAFFVTQQKNNQDAPDPSDLYTVGVIAEIVHVIKLEDGKLKILVEGLRRAKIKKFVNNKKFFQAVIQPLSTDYKKDDATEGVRRSLVSHFEEYAKSNRQINPESIIPILNIENIDRLTDTVIAQMSLKIKVKQELLSLYDPAQRMKKLLDVLRKEIEFIQIERKIDDDVKKRMEQTQKKYFLNEKLKVINKELGKDGEGYSDVEKLENELKDAKLSKEAREKSSIELKRLKSVPPLSAEYGVIKTYLEWIRDLPWGKFTKDNPDIIKARDILDKSHFGLDKVKERIIEFIAVRQLVKKSKGPILCLVGPPGVGKTSLARAIAESVKRNFIRVSLGGVRDEAEIRGHRRTYVGALPGRIIQSMKRVKTQNPLFLLDEIDKMSTDFRGDPSSALLEVLDPEQNFMFSDHYLEICFDLSDVFFITTANSMYSIPHPLLDRMEVIELSGYTELEKLSIAKEFLIPKQLKENGIPKGQLTFDEKAVLNVIREYTREAGVRELERKISSICRKAARQIVEKKDEYKETVKTETLQTFLEKPVYKFGEKEEKAEIGVVTGLAWTEAGGDILSIEVTVVEGSGKLILTGKLGEVMQESAQTAFSFARSKIKEYGLQKDFYKNSDIHIHIPQGAVPKEGPSAGITLCTALISALSRIPVRNDIAMTGEITLRGKVLPIGGVKEKVLSAHRSQIREVLLPEENRKDFDDIPEYVRKKMKFHFVGHIEQVLKIALKDKKSNPAGKKSRTVKKKTAAGKKKKTAAAKK